MKKHILKLLILILIGVPLLKGASFLFTTQLHQQEVRRAYVRLNSATTKAKINFFYRDDCPACQSIFGRL